MKAKPMWKMPWCARPPGQPRIDPEVKEFNEVWSPHRGKNEKERAKQHPLNLAAEACLLKALGSQAKVRDRLQMQTPWLAAYYLCFLYLEPQGGDGGSPDEIEVVLQHQEHPLLGLIKMKYHFGQWGYPSPKELAEMPPEEAGGYLLQALLTLVIDWSLYDD
jgi:hypothetical protein